MPLLEQTNKQKKCSEKSKFLTDSDENIFNFLTSVVSSQLLLQLVQLENRHTK